MSAAIGVSSCRSAFDHARPARFVHVVTQQSKRFEPHVGIAVMIEAARIVSQIVLAGEEVADRLGQTLESRAFADGGILLHQHGRRKYRGREVTPARLALDLLQPRRRSRRKPCFDTADPLLQVANICLSQRRWLWAQVAVEKGPPLGIHVGTVGVVAVIGQNKPQIVRRSEQTVHLLRPVVVAPALPVVRVSAAVFRIRPSRRGSAKGRGAASARIS